MLPTYVLTMPLQGISDSFMVSGKRQKYKFQSI